MTERRIEPRKRTAKAVAELAGVSTTTVSRVLSGRDQAISPETRKRVRSAAMRLKYRPNALAIALRSGVTRSVGLLVPDIGDAYFHQIARGLEDAAQEAGYTVMLCNTDRIATKERSTIQTFADQHVDAIVFAGGGVDDDEHLSDSPWGKVPVVTVGPHRLSCPSIRVDDAGTIALAVQHLSEVGCTRVLCLAGQQNWLINRARLEGYRRAVADNRLANEDQLVLNGSFTVDSGHRLVRDAIQKGITFDGVVAFNDYNAIGGIRALQEHGVRVPEDVKVVGCDDVPIASLVTPRLTSVSFPQYEFGRAAMQTVLDLVAGRSVQPIQEFPYHLEVRESTHPGDASPAG